MNLSEQLIDWRHESEWAWLRCLLDAEYQSELTRQAIRRSHLPHGNFRIDDELKRLLGLK